MLLVLIEVKPIDKLCLQLNVSTRFMNEALKQNIKGLKATILVI